MSELLDQLQLLTGQKSSLATSFDSRIKVSAFDHGEMGVSQLNELLLAAGFDRVSEDFFALLWAGKPQEYEDGWRIKGTSDLAVKVHRFRKLAAVKYGNFKFAFKRWSQMDICGLEDELLSILPERDDYYETRTPPLEDIDEIPIEHRYLLGYISGQDGNDELSATRESVRKMAESNLRKYLTFDHMDVYVATSMRKYRDYVSVGELIRKIFGDPAIGKLKVRYFDPTQAYSEDRLCKGLVESLMLKRAKCAIYCVQETDTYGKDSELAMTLAQGKPVLAYVPTVDNEAQYARDLIESASPQTARCLDALRLYLVDNFPGEVLAKPSLIRSDNVDELALLLARLFKERFDGRADTLLRLHPLALQ